MDGPSRHNCWRRTLGRTSTTQRIVGIRATLCPRAACGCVWRYGGGDEIVYKETFMCVPLVRYMVGSYIQLVE